ncbi:MAG: glycosyltransferase, partial [Chloroflexi bacterium]|nr:glycosyltransferase [Chloroflexota bacterium]
MRVLLTVHHEADPNAGAAGVTIRIADELESRGHRVHLFTTSDLPRWMGPRLKELVFPLAASAKLMSLRRSGLDVADCSTVDALPYLLSRRPKSRPAVITRTHGLERTFSETRIAENRRAGRRQSMVERVYHDGLRVNLAEASMKLADLTLVLSGADLEVAERDLGIPPRR